MKLYQQYLREFRNKQVSLSNIKYINLIDKYHIPKNKTLIFGSSVLAVHGLRPNKDLDIAVTKDVFNSLSSKFIIGTASSGEKFLTDKDHNIEIYYSLGVPGLGFDELMKRADNINGYLFLSIPDMIAWKKKMGRPKDLEDIKLMTPLLHEMSYFISEDNKYYNFDKWESGENKQLYIVGLSGSGKSTLGQDLAKKYNADYIELDDYDREYRNKVRDRLNKSRWNPAVDEIVVKYMMNFFRSIKKRTVVEGVYIMYYEPREFFKDKPLIIMGTSVLLSTIRALKRNIELYHHKAGILDILDDIYKNQKEFITKVKEFERFMDNK